MKISGIQGIIFDMDGTLVDSEINTERAVLWLLGQHGLSAPNLDLRQFHGITWEAIENILVGHFSQLAKESVASRLQHKFHEFFMDPNLPYIAGADQAFRDACKHFPTVIATSSNRESVEYLIKKMGVSEIIAFSLSAEEYSRSKPDPECYLASAKKMGLEPQTCLVFEDSVPGLQAAKSAGMTAVAITKNAIDMETVIKFSDLQISDYHQLPKDFFKLIC